MSPFYPVHGNTTLPEDPLTAARNGASDTVRVLIGSNKDETTLWSVGETDQEKLERTLAGYQAEEALVVYQRTRPEASSHDLLVAITTDHMFRIPAIRLAEARQGAAATYMYQFNWRSRALDGALAATHSLAYDTSTRATMFFDDVCEVVENPDSEERAAWDGIR